MIAVCGESKIVVSSCQHHSGHRTETPHVCGYLKRFQQRLQNSSVCFFEKQYKIPVEMIPFGREALDFFRTHTQAHSPNFPNTPSIYLSHTFGRTLNKNPHLCIIYIHIYLIHIFNYIYSFLPPNINYINLNFNTGCPSSKVTQDPIPRERIVDTSPKQLRSWSQEGDM